MTHVTLGFRYLTGYAVATDPATRERAEWPPHPARIFMALAAAHFESERESAEREALRWLESLTEPPDLYASNADERTVVKFFVPINDKVGTSTALLQSAPGLTRHRAERTFPCVRPHCDCVLLSWKSSEFPEEHRSALSQLCAKVTRIGHSSSLVQMWLEEEPDFSRIPRWEPVDVGGTRQLRKITPGFLKYLEKQFGQSERDRCDSLRSAVEQKKAEKKSLKGAGSKQRKDELQRQIEELEAQLPSEDPPAPFRPMVGAFQGYKRPDPPVNGVLPGTIWDPRPLVFRLVPKAGKTRFQRLDLTSTLQIMQRMREAVIAHAGKNGSVPEFVCGHTSEGSPSHSPHLAYLPLAFVGHQYATGHLLGLAVAIPRNLSHGERRQAIGAVMAVDELKLGPLGCWGLEPEDSEIPPTNLRPTVWTASARGATHWATVTPVVFDKHPKANCKTARHAEMVEVIRQSCNRIFTAANSDQLVEPSEVILSAVSPHLGAPTSREFPRLARKDRSERRHCHALLIFDRSVCGPIAIGAGRYRGYGFCRPLKKQEGTS